ncbi:hypothetical protein KCU65_g370, partial [Aureobasidium melanogenum]
MHVENWERKSRRDIGLAGLIGRNGTKKSTGRDNRVQYKARKGAHGIHVHGNEAFYTLNTLYAFIHISLLIFQRFSARLSRWHEEGSEGHWRPLHSW